jgi:tetratricopeptide (TPR) repeat protein
MALILVLALAGSVGCGAKKVLPAAGMTGPAATVGPVADQSGPTAENSAEAPPAMLVESGQPAAPEPSLSEVQVSALFQEAKNLYQLGQETITSGGDSVEGRSILEQASDIYLQIIEGGGESSMRSEGLLDFITIKDYFARNARDVEKDIPGAIGYYSEIIAAIGDNINSQKQFYLLVTAELQHFEMNDLEAARALYRQALEYCEEIEPGNFSSCSDWEMLQIRYALDVLDRELDGGAWTGFSAQSLSLPNRDFENYYLLAAGLLDSAEMDPAIWSKESGYTDEFYDSATNRKTVLDVLLINCFHGETLAAKDPVLGDGIREKNFQRLLEQFPDHPATMIMLVKQSIHTRKMLRPEEADVYAAQAEQLAGAMNITLIVDQDAPPVQDFLRREYPVAPGAESEQSQGQP